MYNNGDANTKRLVINLMNYAMAARTYFGFVEDLAAPDKAFNSVLTADEKALAWNETLKAEKPLVNEATGEYNPTAYQIHTNLQEAIKLNFVFKDTTVAGIIYWNSSDYHASDIHDATTKTGEATIAVQNAYVTGMIEKIYAFNIYEEFYVRAYNANGQLSKTYASSVAYYLTYMIDNPSGDSEEEKAALVEMCKALLIYGNDARTNDAVNKK